MRYCRRDMATGGAVLVPAGDVAAAVREIGRLLDDPARRASLGAQGRVGVEAAFTERHMAARELAVLERVVAAHAAAQG